MAFSSGNAHGAPMADINTTPLVDVMLVLLIIFMITAPLLAHKSMASLPVKATTLPPTPPVTVTLSLRSQDGTSVQMYWDQDPTDIASVKAKLKEIASVPKESQTTVKIDADDMVPYQQVAEVLAAGNDAGAEKIGFDSNALHAPAGAYR
jgi:biopolymer transport protein ExbD